MYHNQNSGWRITPLLMLLALLLSIVFSAIPGQPVSAATQITAVYSSFNTTNTSAFKMNGTATATASTIRLTDNVDTTYGTAWWEQQVALSNNRSFTAYFTFNMNNGSAQPADGLTFTIQTQSNSAGSTGEGLGYGGISPSVAVEFDTYVNSTSPTFDPAGEHVGINVDGATQSEWTSLQPGLSNGTIYHAWVEYNGASDNFQVRIGTTNNRSTADLLFDNTFSNYSGRALYNVVGENVYVGFTAATGSQNQEHHITSFYFNNDYISGGIDTSTTTYTSSPAIVTISASPTSIYADGSATSTITACTKDSSNVAMANETITFTTTAGSLLSSSVVTAADGCGSVSLRSSTSQTTATVRATASGGVNNTTSVTFTGSPPTSFSAANPPDGTYGVPYNYTFTANGSPPPTYSLYSGTFPSGISIAANGVLSGTPSAAGTFSGFVVRATNALGSLNTGSLDIVINKANTTTTITSDLPDSSAYGQNYTVGVRVDSSTIGTPSGTVTISDGLGQSCSPDLSGGLASCEFSSTVVGDLTLSASYAGDTNFNTSSDTEAHTIIKANTTTTITSDAPDTNRYGETFPVNVSVTPAYSGTPGGSVTIGDGTNTCDAGLTSGNGSCSLPWNNSGNYTLTAVYNGDTNFNTSNDSENHDTIAADTTTVITSPYNPAPYGTPMQLTATVTAVSPSLATPDGQVQFKLNGSNFGDPVTLSGGTALSQNLPTDLGLYTFTVEYSGNSNFNESDSAAFEQVVVPAPTTIVVTSNNNPSIYGEAVTLTATVTANAPSTATPAGSVQFIRNGVNIGAPVSLNASGQAAYTIPFTALWPQNHSITVGFLPTPNFVSSNNNADPLSQVVYKADPLISFTPEKGTVVNGETFSAIVEVASDPSFIGTPSGSVHIIVDGEPFAGPLTLNAQGQATVPGLNFETGSHTVRVQYSGDDYFTNDPVDFSDPVTVNKADTSITAFSFNPTAVVTGQPVTVEITVEVDDPGSGLPTGTVLISNGSDECTLTLDENGEGSCLLTPTNSGQPNLSANYSGDGNFNISSVTPITGPLVTKADTSITTFSYNPVAVVTGQPVTVSVTVRSDAPGSGIPTGTVLVSNGTDECTATLDSNGDGSCFLTPTTSGQPTLSASYSGDDNYNISNADPISGLLVAKADTSITTFSFSPTNVVTGQTVLVEVSIESDFPGSGIPTGTVLISNGIDECTITLDENGDGTCELISTAVGQPDLTANYSGDENYSVSSAGPLTGPLVTKADTSITTFSFSAADVVTGQLVTVEVSVESDFPGSGIPTGTVLISNGSDECTITLDENGDGTCELIPIAVGQPNLTANYSGDDNYNPSSDGPLTGPVVTKADTSITTFSFSPAEVVTGQTVLVAVNVESDEPGSGVPTGTVLISNGSDECTVTLDENGDGSCELIPTTIGQPDLSASYSGDDNYFVSSAGPIIGPLVAKADTSITTFSFSPETVVVGQPVTVSVSVETSAPGSGIPSATVLISNGNDECTVTLDGNGDGSCELTPTAPGQPNLTANYSGNENYNGTSATPITGPLVNKADTTSVTLSSDNQSIYGQPVTFTATISVDEPGNGTPTGQVQFYIDGVAFGDPVAVSSNQALSESIWNLNTGNHTIRAEYSGDSNFNSSISANSNQEVLIVGTSLTLSSDQNPAPYGETVTVTATVVADDPSIAVPDGLVQFLFNGVDYGAPVEMVNGQAQKVLPFTALWVGTHNLTVEYLGTSNFETSNTFSSPLAQVIGKAEVDVNFSASVSPSVYGQAVDFTVTVVSLNGNITGPTGTIDILIDGISFGDDLVMNGSGQVIISGINSLTVGDHTIIVKYSGDDQYLAYDEQVESQDPIVFVDAHTVNKANASINFDSITDMNLVVGEETTVTLTVSAVLPGVGIPSGTVEISNGLGDTCEITLDGSGSGTCTFTPTTIASGDLTASYLGDTNFNEVVSDPVTGPTVTQASTTTTITGFDNGTIVVGEDTTVSTSVVSVAPGSGTPTGSVVISNGIDECTAPLSEGSGSCNLRPTAPDVDGLTLTAVYQGDTNYQTSTSISVTGAIVIKADTEILNLTFNPTNPVIGQETTVSLSVGVQAPGHGTPTGKVTISNGIESCEITLTNGAGTCNYAPNTVTTPSAESITMNYEGDTNFNPIVDEIVTGPVVSKADTIVSIVNYDPTSLYLGQPTVVEVRVSAKAPGAGTPTNQVTVTTGSEYCIAYLDENAEGTCELTPNIIGQVSLQATYNGDTRYNTSTNGQIPGPIVNKAPTITTITNISETDLVVSQPVEVSVSVITDPNPALPDVSMNLMQMMLMDMPVLSGNVLVTNGTDECLATLSGGIGSCFLSPSAVGSPDFYATYQGNANFAQSTSLAETGPSVTPASVSIVSMDFSPENPVAGQPVTITMQAQVDAPGTGYPSGTIEVTNGTDSCLVTLDENGQGSCEFIPSDIGNPDLAASFGGNSNFNPSPGIQEPGPTVTQANTSVIISGVTTAVIGSSLQWTATVAGHAPSEGTPEGLVQFYINGTAHGSPIPLVNGVAVSEEVSDLTVGSYSVTAKFSETTAYAESTSSVLNLDILPDTYHVFIPMVIR